MTVAPLGGSPQVFTWAEPQMRRCYSVGWGLVDPQMTPHIQTLGAERSPADLGKRRKEQQQGLGCPACRDG